MVRRVAPVKTSDGQPAAHSKNWLKSFGAGGGKKIAVIGEIDPATGDLLRAAHLSAVLSSGATNSLSVNDISLNEAGNLVVSASSFSNPRRPDR